MDNKPTYEELEQRIKNLENESIPQKNSKHQSVNTEAIYRLMLESISDTVILTDDLGNMVYVCPNTKVIFGYSQDEIYAQETIQNFLHGSVCDLAEIKRKGEIENIERSIKRSSGEGRFLLINVKSVNIEGGTILYVMHDITDRKIAEEHLEKYKNIVSSTIDGIAFLDRNYRYIIVNDAYEKFSGVDRGEFIGKTVSEYLGEDIFKKYIKDNFDRSLQGEIVNYQEWFDYPTLGKRFVDITYSPYRDSDNQISGIIASTRDITDSKKTEASLQQSEEMFRALFEQAGGYCMILDPNTSDGIPLIIDANEAACKAHGFTREEFINRPVADIDDEDGKRLVKKRTAEIMTGEPFYVENVHVRKDGTTFPVAVNAKRIDIRNSKSLILTTEYDISERKIAEQQLKESKERFELAMEAARDGLYDWNLKTNEIYYSPGWKRMLGYLVDEIPDDFSVWEKLTDPRDVKKSWEMQQELVNNERDRFEMEFSMKHKKGHWVDILSRANAVFDEDGKAVRIIGTHVDISERKRLEANLLQAQKMEAIGNLAGGIAHDFNNILSSIIGFTELALEAAPEGSAQKDDLEEVYLAGNRAKELVQQILAFARKSVKETKPIRLSDIVAEVLKLLRPSTPMSIDIKSIINSTAKVMGNDSQLHQTVMNICTNAIHSLQKSGDTLEITLRDIVVKDYELETSKLPPGEYVELTITDNGPGIDPAIIKNIFEPYFTTKGVGEGTGMGLAMVKGIVEGYGGDIEVQSELGEKTSFTIRFPVATVKSFDTKTQIAPIASGTESILFVDDESPIARMGSRMLESLGYTVTIRTSSFEALELFKEKPDAFDLVITDMTMPAMAGDEFSIEIRKIRQDIPIILCTGYSNKINEVGAKQIGIDAFAYKPFTKPDLAKIIREVLDTNQSSSV